VTDKNSPAFAAEKSIMLNAMPELFASKGLENATYNLTNNVFTIKAEAISITINTRDDLVITTTLVAEGAGSAGKQVIMTTYGISKEAQAIFDAAQ
jgi:hypothetical protein